MRLTPSSNSKKKATLSRIGITLVLPFMIVSIAQLPGQCADFERWQECLKSGEESYKKQHWGKAEHFYSKAVRYADRSDVGDKNLAMSLRKLGEANIAAKKYHEAEDHLQRAIKIAKDCGEEDREAIRDLLELAKTYRSVNLEQFGKNVAAVLKETGLDGIEILNTKDGKSRVIVRFADKFNKHITSPGINEINLDKKLTFDIHEDKDGTITLNNIKGLKVHSKVWANLTHSSINPHGGKGTPTALVTAEKLGLTKTVQTVLPKPVYDRILVVVERIKHPELHSPWHKQLQERISATPKAKPAVPITITDTSKDNTGEAKADTATTTSTSSTTSSSGTTATTTTPAEAATGETATAEAATAEASTNAPSTTAAPSPSTTTEQQKSPPQFAAEQAPTANTEVTGDVVSPVKN